LLSTDIVVNIIAAANIDLNDVIIIVVVVVVVDAGWRQLQQR